MGAWHSMYAYPFSALNPDQRKPPSPPIPPPAPKAGRPPLLFVPTYQRTVRDARGDRKTQMTGVWKRNVEAK